jgi:NAD(P)H-hydrate repair Nnr-like enzyme with NAD(P)H-hydrate epimerase domain
LTRGTNAIDAHSLQIANVSLTASVPRLSTEQAIGKIDLMKITKNIGMILLAVYLIVDALLGFGLQLGPAIFLLYIVALAAGVFILIGK